ncbi:hypothetical protein OnM2_010026, partial [Erysiphe neolycopersici]
FFNASIHAKVKFSLLTSTCEFVEALRATQSHVFMVPGVSIPPKYMSILSLNGKFFLHSQMNSALVKKAIAQLRRTIRIRWFFRDSLVIPTIYLNSIGFVVSTTTPSVPRNAVKHNPEIQNLIEFLREALYLVKITDKNLGLAVVVSLEWYNNQCE